GRTHRKLLRRWKAGARTHGACHRLSVCRSQCPVSGVLSAIPRQAAAREGGLDGADRGTYGGPPEVLALRERLSEAVDRRRQGDRRLASELESLVPRFQRRDVAREAPGASPGMGPGGRVPRLAAS